MYEKLLNIVINLGSPKILLVGDFMLDVYVYGDALRISPEAPVPVLKVTKTEYGCGGAGSVAINLATLGATPICIGVVGNDKNGETLKKMLNDAAVDTGNIFTVTDRPTITKQRLIGLAQHRHRQQLMRIDEESSESLSKTEHEKILQVYKENLPQADIVCLQDYNKGLLSDSLCEKMIQAARNAGKKIIIDPSPIVDYSKYTSASLITPNRKEASAAVGFDIETNDDAKKAANKLYKKLKLDAAVITLDKEGAYLKANGINRHLTTRVRKVYDVTGAGDIVLATLAIVLAAGCDYETAVKLSNITGGIEVEKFGASAVTIEEIINEIILQNRQELGKLRSITTLTAELDWHRKQNRKIVFTNGCFDVLHRGHIEFLKFCKSHGDILVLGLNSDNSVKTIKGPERPINNQHDRAEVLSALETIDYIVIFDEPDPLKTIEQIKPDVLVKGRDWEHKGVVGREFVESKGGKVVLAPLVKGKSTTKTIEKMKSLGKN